MSRFGLLDSLATQVNANRDERRAKAEAEDAFEDEESDDEEAYDDAFEPVEDLEAEAPVAEVAEKSEPQARPAARRGRYPQICWRCEP